MEFDDSIVPPSFSNYENYTSNMRDSRINTQDRKQDQSSYDKLSEYCNKLIDYNPRLHSHLKKPTPYDDYNRLHQLTTENYKFIIAVRNLKVIKVSMVTIGAIIETLMKRYNYNINFTQTVVLMITRNDFIIVSTLKEYVDVPKFCECGPLKPSIMGSLAESFFTDGVGTFIAFIIRKFDTNISVEANDVSKYLRRFISNVCGGDDAAEGIPTDNSSEIDDWMGKIFTAIETLGTIATGDGLKFFASLFRGGTAPKPEAKRTTTPNTQLRTTSPVAPNLSKRVDFGSLENM